MKNKDFQDDRLNSRREFLKKAGRFAAYTPPAMMMLMKPSHASIQKSGGMGNGGTYGGTVKPTHHRPTHWWGKVSWWGRFWK